MLQRCRLPLGWGCGRGDGGSGCCGFAARFGALEPEVLLQEFRLGAVVLDDGWRSLSVGRYHYFLLI